MYLISLYFDNYSTNVFNDYLKIIQEKTKNNYMIYHKIPPHLTVATLHDCNEEMMINHLDHVIKKINEDFIDVVSIGSFLQNTIYLTPLYNQYLHDISVKINGIVNQLDRHREHNRYRPFHWLPHITMARKLNEAELNIAFASLNQIFKPMHVKVTRIALSKSQPYQDIYVWNLKGEKT
ncbi:MAG: 2'-5' RNA ligase family protein [Succinatimonas sp.]|nr:2'-5' RNA ligase family protein [Succinatimonas sp.]